MHRFFVFRLGPQFLLNPDALFCITFPAFYFGDMNLHLLVERRI